jgi:hypothetical protein
MTEQDAALEQIGDAVAQFLTIVMRGLKPTAVSAMNDKLASGLGGYRFVIEAHQAGLRCAVAFVTTAGDVPLADVFVGEQDWNSSSDEHLGPLH